MTGLSLGVQEADRSPGGKSDNSTVKQQEGITQPQLQQEAQGTAGLIGGTS